MQMNGMTLIEYYNEPELSVYSGIDYPTHRVETLIGILVTL